MHNKISELCDYFDQISKVNKQLFMKDMECVLDYILKEMKDKNLCEVVRHYTDPLYGIEEQVQERLNSWEIESVYEALSNFGLVVEFNRHTELISFKLPIGKVVRVQDSVKTPKASILTKVKGANEADNSSIRKRKINTIERILSGEKNIIADGDLDLSYNLDIVSLPEGLVVKGCLYLSGCSNLRYLSEGLVVNGSLFLDGCTKLTHLPEDLVVKRGTYLYGCTDLESLPEDLVVKGDVYPPNHLK